MPTYEWASPYPYQVIGPKQFGASIRSSEDLDYILDMTAGALSEINGGTVWRQKGRPTPRPDVSEDALEITATAAYQGSREPGQIILQAVAQPSIDLRQTGLVLTFQDSGRGFGPNWMEQVSEEITAATVLHVGESLHWRMTGRATGGNPCLPWTILQGAWHAGGMVNYAGWNIMLRS
jgi:hypothetical protein